MRNAFSRLTPSPAASIPRSCGDERLDRDIERHPMRLNGDDGETDAGDADAVAEYGIDQSEVDGFDDETRVTAQLLRLHDHPDCFHDAAEHCMVLFTIEDSFVGADAAPVDDAQTPCRRHRLKFGKREQWPSAIAEHDGGNVHEQFVD